MATLRYKILPFTTSPRTPSKMIPEIRLLGENFTGEMWNTDTQAEFMDELAESDFFEGSGSPSDKAFSARDRITRAPKALGFVDLSPLIRLTPAGKAFVYGKRPQEIFLRQLLKFQLPSPYHKEAKDIEGTFWIHPYLEIFRLIRDLGYLTFDEFKIYAVRMTDFQQFDDTKDAILNFRSEKQSHKGQYKKFVNDKWEEAVMTIYEDRIREGKTKTRETKDSSLLKFIKTQKSNMRDYTDAAFRYLRYTGLVAISQKEKSISIMPERAEEVDFFLRTAQRSPEYVDDEREYKHYLFDASEPALYTDDRRRLIILITSISDYSFTDLSSMPLETLKDLRDDLTAQRKQNAINAQILRLKTYQDYIDIMKTYENIEDYYDSPLMLEYNTWRAMTMLDGGDIKGNFNFDDDGQPMSTAAGNVPDIECDYDDFVLSVEVTMQNGQRQYEMEGEPVARHYGQLKQRTGKETYCLFITPYLNPATLAHFYGLDHVPIALYGGKSQIIPLNLDQFEVLIEHSYQCSTQSKQPCPADVKQFLDNALDQGDYAADENDWESRIQECVDKWLVSS